MSSDVWALHWKATRSCWSGSCTDATSIGSFREKLTERTFEASDPYTPDGSLYTFAAVSWNMACLSLSL